MSAVALEARLEEVDAGLAVPSREALLREREALLAEIASQQEIDLEAQAAAATRYAELRHQCTSIEAATESYSALRYELHSAHSQALRLGAQIEPLPDPPNSHVPPPPCPCQG